MTAQSPALRRDAARNRALILEIAAAVFAESGLNASYDEIARRAGVGVGTVYRRFPERSELVQALFEARIEEIVGFAEEAARHSSAWEGLCWFLERLIERQVADRGLKEVMLKTISKDQHEAVGRERLGPRIETMVERARDEGALRSDVSAPDLGVLIMVISSLWTTNTPELWRRYLALALDAMRARPDQPLLPDAPPDEQDLQDLMH
ncbi:MAG: TetR/AcrR family transcriptional regulator [Nocardioides sp.]